MHVYIYIYLAITVIFSTDLREIIPDLEFRSFYCPFIVNIIS